MISALVATLLLVAAFLLTTDKDGFGLAVFLPSLVGFGLTGLVATLGLVANFLCSAECNLGQEVDECVASATFVLMGVFLRIAGDSADTEVDDFVESAMLVLVTDFLWTAEDTADLEIDEPGSFSKSSFEWMATLRTGILQVTSAIGLSTVVSDPTREVVGTPCHLLMIGFSFLLPLVDFTDRDPALCTCCMGFGLSGKNKAGEKKMKQN